MKAKFISLLLALVFTTAAPVANAGIFGWFGELMNSVAVFVTGSFD